MKKLIILLAIMIVSLGGISTFASFERDYTSAGAVGELARQAKRKAYKDRQRVTDPNQAQSIPDDLTEVVAAWPKLSPETRKTIIEMVW